MKMIPSLFGALARRLVLLGIGTASLLRLLCIGIGAVFGSGGTVKERITKALTIPTIGIGAGKGCDGQVLVWHDLLGLTSGPTPTSRSSSSPMAGRW